MLHRSRQRLIDGFTVVELIVIIVVIGILAGIVYGTYGVVTRDAFNTRVASDMSAYRNGFEVYAAQENHFPAVPRSGNYCLGTGGMTGTEINSRGYAGTPLPANLTSNSVTEESYYCRDLGAPATRHSNYPPLSRDLRTVVELDQRGNAADYIVDPWTGGIYAHYAGTDPDEITVTIYGWVKGDECPTETTFSWSDADGNKALCYITLPKTYPVEFTGETWPAAG